MRPVAKLPKLPTGLGAENALKRIFERSSGLFGVSPCLAFENFDGHVEYSLVLVHKHPFPYDGSPYGPGRNRGSNDIRAGEAPPVKSRRSPARATNPGRVTPPVPAAS